MPIARVYVCNVRYCGNVNHAIFRIGFFVTHIPVFLNLRCHGFIWQGIDFFPQCLFVCTQFFPHSRTRTASEYICVQRE